jgi:ABC-2 type transport system ATP-binding protein
MVNRPEVLFLDEPVSALDPAGRKEVLEMVQQLRGQCTVFMSTHILDDVERVCDSVGIINQGRLLVESPKDELRARYAVPAFEIECAEGASQALHTWAQTVQSLSWVSAVVCNGTVARVTVKDVAFARQALLARIVEAGLSLQRYEVVTPSLEDIFLQIVA